MKNKEKSAENPHAGHRSRMRERFAETGLNGFSDHEVLEMLLYYAVSRSDTNALAHKLLAEFGTLQNVVYADAEALTNVDGVGEKIVHFLKFTGAFHDYLECSAVRNIPLKSIENRCLYFRAKLRNCPEETLLLACLDDDLNVIRCFTVSSGSSEEVSVQMQTIARMILSVRSSRVMIAHNHPMGKAEPSSADISCTHQICKSLRGIGVDLLDHIIVARDGVCSMLKMGIFMPDMI